MIHNLEISANSNATLYSRYSISNRSTQSNMCIARSANNVVNTFGSQLPITVNEALMFTDSKTDVSINCSDNGWSWAISGRKLFVWQYKDIKEQKLDNFRTPQRRTAISQCRELTLPHCDIGHKASLITVFTTDEQQMASCLSISPTGDVRFWSSIAQDALSVDEMGILDGQEFDQLIKISAEGYVLATTTCNLVLLQLQMHNGRHTIVHRDVRPPTGFLGGIGKRFASILIGNHANDRENVSTTFNLCGYCFYLPLDGTGYIKLLLHFFFDSVSLKYVLIECVRPIGLYRYCPIASFSAGQSTQTSANRSSLRITILSRKSDKRFTIKFGQRMTSRELQRSCWTCKRITPPT